MSRVQEANVRAFRQKHGLMQDSGRGCGRSSKLTFSRQARQWWRWTPGK